MTTIEINFRNAELKFENKKNAKTANNLKITRSAFEKEQRDSFKLSPAYKIIQDKRREEEINLMNSLRSAIKIQTITL